MSDVDRLAGFVADHRRLVVVTGAGCSTDSGIGDYRDAAGQWKHSKPIQYADFMADESVRRRYWARSMLGWPQFAQATPNIAHRVLAKLESNGCLSGLITQNVDRLHQQAGHREMLDLHGRLDRVSCQDCGTQCRRSDLQFELVELNGGMLPELEDSLKTTEPAPDGDAELSEVKALLAREFTTPTCKACGGILKPDVVFYGQSVPKPWVEMAYRWVDEADALLVVGSSLMVFSSYRFCKAAAAASKPICILNRGVTRADELAALKIDAACGVTLGGLFTGEGYDTVA